MTTVTLALDGQLARGRLPNLCRSLWMLLACSGATLAVCDLSRTRADVATVDALARLKLHARRRGCTVLLRKAPDELIELVELMVLSGLL
jgi:ABC-type transporter Mla MlaB component